jgi:hypothetical protein
VFRVEAAGLRHPNEGGGAKALFVGAVASERSKRCVAAPESWRSAPGPARRGARLPSPSRAGVASSPRRATATVGPPPTSTTGAAA